MKEKSEFYTLKGYQTKEKKDLTEAMEDYLEMVYRNFLSDKRIRINELARLLNVKPSSVSKMITKLKDHNLVFFEPYSDIYLTEKGMELGKYLLWRHDTLVKFLKGLNKEQYHLDQVEKIEHFIDHITLLNMEKMIPQFDI